MKKQIITILSIMIILILGITSIVNAADATVTLKSDKTEVEPGGTFTITVSGACEDGINGLTGSLSYDKDQLELVSAKSADTEKWSSLGQNSEGNVEIAIIANSSDIKNGDVFKATFKVKDSVAIGTTIKVTPSNIILDSLAETNSEHSDTGAKEVSVLVSQKATEPGDETPGTTKPGTTTSGTTKPGTTTLQSQNTSKKNTSQNKIEYQNIAKKNTNTQSQAKMIPYTGASMLIGVATFAVGTIAVVSYISYKRYKNI